jgi:hemerythrin
MSSFSWEPSFSVDLEPMDIQHMKILDMMTSIHNLLSDKQQIDAIDEMLDQFDIYCKMHFYEEERLMEGMNFPSIAEHKRQHDLFILNLDRFKSADLANQNRNFAVDFEKVKNWFVNHILTEDMRYSEFYLGKHSN